MNTTEKQIVKNYAATTRIGAAWLRSLLAGSMLCCFAACRQEPGLTPTKADPWPFILSLSTNQIDLGTPFAARFTARHPKGSVIDLPSPERDKYIIQRNVTRHEKAIDETTTETSLSFDLTSLRIGTHLLWTQDVRCVSADGTVWNKSLPDTRIEVRSVLTNSTESLHDIAGPVNWPARTSRLFILIVAAILLTLFILFYLILHRVRRQAAANQPPPPPAHIVALQSLEALLQKGLIEAHRVEEYYVELSLIVRTYLENRFHLRAPEQTTEEFIHDAVHSRILSDTQQDVLRAFLEQSDMVKFARAAPDENDMRNAYLAAKSFVEETKPVDPTAEVQP